MPAKVRKQTRLRQAAALGVTLSGGLLVAGSAIGANVKQLQNQLNSTQSQLNATRTHQKTLSGSIAVLNGQVTALTDQIALVESRQAAAQAQLTSYDQALAQTRAQLDAEQLRLRRLRRSLHRARMTLSAELVTQYEQPPPSFVSMVIDANGFNQLLSQLQYLNSAKQDEQKVIRVTESARRQALAATDRIRKLEVADEVAAGDAHTQTAALSGMSALLASRQAALDDERAAQTTALAATQAKGTQLRSAIQQIQQQEEAAIQAAQTITPAPSGTGTGTNTGGGGSGLGPSAGWAIPYSIVLCESGGQNLPPNSAGASGYYQIIPSTWKDFGGSGPAAYLASKSEQDAVASRIWNGGAGASNWACARIVGIT